MNVVVAVKLVAGVMGVLFGVACIIGIFSALRDDEVMAAAFLAVAALGFLTAGIWIVGGAL